MYAIIRSKYVNQLVRLARYDRRRDAGEHFVKKVDCSLPNRGAAIDVAPALRNTAGRASGRADMLRSLQGDYTV